MSQRIRKLLGSPRDLIYLPIIAIFFVLTLIFGSYAMEVVLGLLNLALLAWITLVLMRDPDRIPPTPRERLGGFAQLSLLLGVCGWYLFHAITEGKILEAIMLVAAIILSTLCYGILCDFLPLRPRL